MDFRYFLSIILTINIVFIRCSHGDRYEGSPCTLYNGDSGICKKIDQCEYIKTGIMRGTLRYENIVQCSFVGSVQVACCADEKPIPGRNRPTQPAFQRPNNDFVFTPTPNTVIGVPSSSGSRTGRGAKAEAACDTYSKLPTTNTITFNILGGIPTNLGEFPWMAAIGYPDENDEISFDCGGTIISEEFVLTAAHCAPSRRKPQMVRLGKVTLLTDDDETEPVDITIKNIIRHPNYNAGTKKNDIALVHLNQRISFNENVRPACLRTDLSDVATNTELLVTGWGTVSAERTKKSSILLKTNVTSMPLYLCNRTLVNYNSIINQRSLRDGLSEGQYCAFDPLARNDACQGDSGGPLQILFNEKTMASIIGVVSFGISCGTELPSIYTRVAFYVDWIESIVWPNLR